MQTTLEAKISGRNKLDGTVTNIIPGTVTAEVELDIGNSKMITGVITKKSLDEMQIRKGDELTALIKATSVMFIKE
ncbi:MAG TPA: TOBE domain-containing protein [Firmicutes bacterium]|jgi:molybdopterin-binding protein|nr:TOBE domain-containing protein [Bacillota bacterium]